MLGFANNKELLKNLLMRHQASTNNVRFQIDIKILKGFNKLYEIKKVDV